MAKIERLKVLMNGQEVGLLERATSGAISFKYVQKWLDRGEQAIPISSSLPVQQQVYRGSSVSYFFENLLPENPNLREKLADKAIAKSTGTFDLLAAIGKDCVGALQVVGENYEVKGVEAIKFQKVSRKQIAEVLKNLEKAPMGMMSEEDFRISLAGMQEKTAFLKYKNSWCIPEGSSATTHIFKTPMGELINGIDMSTSVENEWLCLKFCEKLGLKVANADIERFGDQKCLVVERFDRAWSSAGDKLFRVPQEDMCQALGFPSSQKYQADGGPAVKDIMGFLMNSEEWAQDRKDFIKAQVIFYLLGAIDGHAKNFSVFLRPGGVKMTPLYDVLTGYLAFENKQVQLKKFKLAMSVGDNKHFKMNDIYYRHWVQQGKMSKMKESLVKEIIEEVLQCLPGVLRTSESDLPKDFPADILMILLSGIQTASERLKESML